MRLCCDILRRYICWCALPCIGKRLRMHLANLPGLLSLFMHLKPTPFVVARARISIAFSAVLRHIFILLLIFMIAPKLIQVHTAMMLYIFRLCHLVPLNDFEYDLLWNVSTCEEKFTRKKPLYASLPPTLPLPRNFLQNCLYRLTLLYLHFSISFRCPASQWASVVCSCLSYFSCSGLKFWFVFIH